MILADKIIEERKRCGWSQEELAAKLSVSRQSVSKWESAQSVPDLQRVIQLADLFEVSTDYLLKDEIEQRPLMSASGVLNGVTGAAALGVDSGSEVADSFFGENPSSVAYAVPVGSAKACNPHASLRKVTMEEANEFLDLKLIESRRVSLATALCILSPAVLIALSGVAADASSIQNQGSSTGAAGSALFAIPEGIAAAIGLLVLLTCVAVAVFMFIRSGESLREYRFLSEESFETAYGVTGMVKERSREFASTYSTCLSVGVVMCILSAVPLVVVSCLGARAYLVCLMVSLLLIVVAIGVYLIVRVGTVHSSYNALLQEGDYSPAEKRDSKRLAPFATIFWLLAVALYLGWSFATDDWDFTWIVWPIAGVLYGVVVCIAKLVFHSK